MLGRRSLIGRLVREVVPTPGQVLLVMLTSAALIVAGRSQMVLSTIGITPEGVKAAGATLRQQFEVVLVSPIVSNFVLITFWAAVGMAVYLVCWGLYAAWIETRNEVVLQHEYMNAQGRGAHWRVMGIKALCAAFLVTVLAAFGPILALAQLVAAPVFYDPKLATFVGLGAALTMLAIWLYLILLCVQLTFTPWYDDGVFTD